MEAVMQEFGISFPSDADVADEVVLNGVPGRGATRFDAQLRVDGSKVGVDGPGANAELLGQLPVREADGDES
jgi:hypothetical protein